MSQAAQLDELLPPLRGTRVLFHGAYDLEGVEELVDRAGVQKLVPNSAVVSSAAHPSELFDVCLQFSVHRQLLKQVPCAFDKVL